MAAEQHREVSSLRFLIPSVATHFPGLPHYLQQDSAAANGRYFCKERMPRSFNRLSFLAGDALEMQEGQKGDTTPCFISLFLPFILLLTFHPSSYFSSMWIVTRNLLLSPADICCSHTTLLLLSFSPIPTPPPAQFRSPLGDHLCFWVPTLLGVT